VPRRGPVLPPFSTPLSLLPRPLLHCGSELGASIVNRASSNTLSRPPNPCALLRSSIETDRSGSDVERRAHFELYMQAFSGAVDAGVGCAGKDDGATLERAGEVVWDRLSKF
jgi:hypothetical protein